MKWERQSKNEFLKHIQINPLSISPAGLGDYTYGESVIEIPGLVERRGENEEFNKVEFEKRLETMRNLVLENHDYCGEGETNLPVYSYFSFFFPVDVYFEGVGPFPIFRPQAFTVILKGMDLGVKYVLSFDSHGQCNFLEEDLCSIHEIKPVACQRFPFNQDGALRVDERVLEICCGINSSL
ncbi:MAG: YkgJ family cysteine cluster protein [Promethearchaeota archaeon]